MTIVYSDSIKVVWVTTRKTADLLVCTTTGLTTSMTTRLSAMSFLLNGRSPWHDHAYEFNNESSLGQVVWVQHGLIWCISFSVQNSSEFWGKPQQLTSSKPNNKSGLTTNTTYRRSLHHKRRETGRGGQCVHSAHLPPPVVLQRE